jgi:hypothetical protein
MADENGYFLPKISEHAAIIGATGSGKTQHGAWVLSNAPFDRIPYVILNFKTDALLSSIDRAKQITYADLPKVPGVYILNPEPWSESSGNSELETWLRKVWERGGIGLFVDEAYMMPRDKAYPAILTQGRSRRVPTINLMQRPVWVPRFVFSEASFFTVFRLSVRDDQKKVEEILPQGSILPVPEFFSIWYNVKKNVVQYLRPTETADEILDRFEFRLKPRRTVLRG